MSTDDPNSLHPEPPAKKVRKVKTYVPSLRSGPYALILALSSLPEDQSVGLTKAQLIEQAQEHCDSSFTAPVDTTKFYTAWNSMKTLVDKDLVYEKGRPLRRYLLSDEGWEVAKKIRYAQGGRQGLPGVGPFNTTERFPTSSVSANHAELGVLTNQADHPGTPDRPYKAKPRRGESQEAEVPDVTGFGRDSDTVKDDQLGTSAASHNQVSHSERAPILDRDFIELLSSPEPRSGPHVATVGPTFNTERDMSGARLGVRSAGNFSESPPDETSGIDVVGVSNITPIRLQPDTFTVQLVLDSREVRAKNDRDYIHDELVKLGVNTLVRPFELGDFFWVAKCREPGLLGRLGEEGDEIALDWIIERKRLDDLVGSIKDGRFQEQKFRFRKLGVQNVVYIIEDFTMSSERISQFHDAIETAIGSTQVIDEYFVKRTMKLDDTIRYLARMTAMLKRLYEVRRHVFTQNAWSHLLIFAYLQSKPLHVIPSSQLKAETYLPILTHLRTTVPQISHHITYTSFCALASKTDSLTLRDIFLKMLMCTRGVTGDKALEVQKHWTTPRAMVEALEGCEGSKGREALLETKLGGKVGRRKLGKAVSAKVAEIWGEA